MHRNPWHRRCHCISLCKYINTIQTKARSVCARMTERRAAEAPTEAAPSAHCASERRVDANRAGGIGVSATFSGTNLRRTRRARCKRKARDERRATGGGGGRSERRKTGFGVRKFECISRVCNLCADPKPRLMKNKVKNLTPQTFSPFF